MWEKVWILDDPSFLVKNNCFIAASLTVELFTFDFWTDLFHLQVQPWEASCSSPCMWSPSMIQRLGFHHFLSVQYHLEKHFSCTLLHVAKLVEKSRWYFVGPSLKAWLRSCSFFKAGSTCGTKVEFVSKPSRCDAVTSRWLCLQNRWKIHHEAHGF